jgi:Tfp pilus assembly protein PilO
VKKRDIGILIGLGVIVLLVAWWFLIITPMKDDAAAKQSEYQQQKNTYDQNLARVQRIDEERLAARQASSDLLSLNKLIPANEQVPSMIIELQATANDAGIKFMKIAPQDPVAASGGGTVVPFELEFQGQIFDVNDFLYRVENYARMQGNEVDVSGRLISVVTIEMVEPQIGGGFPDVLVKLGANAYMTDPAPAPKTAGRASNTGGAESSGSTAGG